MHIHGRQVDIQARNSFVHLCTLPGSESLLCISSSQLCRLGIPPLFREKDCGPRSTRSSDYVIYFASIKPYQAKSLYRRRFSETYTAWVGNVEADLPTAAGILSKFLGGGHWPAILEQRQTSVSTVDSNIFTPTELAQMVCGLVGSSENRESWRVLSGSPDLASSIVTISTSRRL